jgi:hypothetical protein
VKVLVLVSFIYVQLVASIGPQSYAIKKLPAGKTISIDGNAADWNESFFIDSLHGDENVYKRPRWMEEWITALFQYKLYLAHTSSPTPDGDTGYVYGLAVVTRDPAYMVGNGANFDNLKIDPPDHNAGLYLNSNGSNPRFNSACPYSMNRTLFARVTTYGQDSLPVYEFALRKDIFDPEELAKQGVPVSYSFGSEENKPPSYDQNVNDQVFLAVGAYRVSTFKDDWSYSLDYASFYPAFTFSSEEGSFADTNAHFTLISPSTDTTICETDLINFKVAVYCPTGQPLVYYWFKNDTLVSSGQGIDKYKFETGYGSSGRDTITVIVFYGNDQITHTWIVTINNGYADCGTVNETFQNLLSAKLELSSAMPNPYNPSTLIRYSVPSGKPSFVTIRIIDSRGNEVRRLMNGSVAPGYHSILFDGRNNNGELLTTGIYLCRMESAAYNSTLRLVMIK